MEQITRPRAISAFLIEAFPRCFMQIGASKVPLKVGIAADILERCPQISPNGLRRALSDYTRRTTYRRHLKLGATRFNLDGLADGDVTAEHIERRKKAQPPVIAETLPARPILRLRDRPESGPPQ